jgi:integrase
MTRTVTRVLHSHFSCTAIQRGEITVPKSKTAAGTGRVIPLSRRVCACLSLWLERFPGAVPESFLFPAHKVGLAGNSHVPVLYRIDLGQPMGSWRKAWKIACRAAGARYRPHDMRHTFISRLAENPNVSEQTIKALAGHVSRQMLERYRPHPFAGKAGCDAGARIGSNRADFASDRAQNRAQRDGLKQNDRG